MIYFCAKQTIWSINYYYTYSPAMLKRTNAEYSFTEMWFTDQNNRPLEIEDNSNIILIIGTA